MVTISIGGPCPDVACRGVVTWIHEMPVVALDPAAEVMTVLVIGIGCSKGHIFHVVKSPVKHEEEEKTWHAVESEMEKLGSGLLTLPGVDLTKPSTPSRAQKVSQWFTDLRARQHSTFLRCGPTGASANFVTTSSGSTHLGSRRRRGSGYRRRRRHSQLRGAR